jgi:hypothetical protein
VQATGKRNLARCWSAHLGPDGAAIWNWPVCRASKGWKPMARHRTHCVESRRQVAQEYLGGEILHGQANRPDISRNLIRV